MDVPFWPLRKQICLHSTGSIPYVLIAVGAYGLDRVLRFVKTRYAYAYLTPIPELGMTKVEIPVLSWDLKFEMQVLKPEIDMWIT